MEDFKSYVSFLIVVAHQGTFILPEKSSADPIRLACQDFFTIQSAHQNRATKPGNNFIHDHPSLDNSTIPPKWVAFVLRYVHSLSVYSETTQSVQTDLFQHDRPSRNRPKLSSNATTQSSLSTSRPTSAYAMKSPSSPPSVFATRSACYHPNPLLSYPPTKTFSTDRRLHHPLDEAHPTWSRPRHLLQAPRRRA